MLNGKGMKNAARLLSGLLLASVLLAAAEPIPAYASSDNQGAMDAFPALGVSSDTMNENNGTISTLYGGGTIGDNKGTISSSRGTVYANHGSIESLSAGKVGINYGTINRIENTGLLEINYEDGTVGFVGMGNEVGRNDGTIQVTAGLIGENDGTIQENTGTVNHSYSKVSSNKGTVTMHSGSVGKNEKSGVVLVENNTVSRIKLNEGSVIISNGSVEIDVNTGNIEITNANVFVGENHGNITLGKGANLTCPNNQGHIIDESAVWYKIVFKGDDGTAAVTECDKEENGFYYTQAGSNVTFTLPPEYECSSGMIWEAGNVNTWIVNAAPEAGSTEFTIFCHICTPGEYRIDTEKHWRVCAECGKALEAEAHTFDQQALYKPATCTESALYFMECETCGTLDIFPVGDPAGHSWDAGEVTTPATHEAEGVKTYSCTVCKETKTEPVPKLKEDPVRDFVLRFYTVCLGRDKPDENEIAHYVWEITDNGMTGSEVAGKFIFSEEFCMKNYCDRHYVEALYK
ncbi:MAG: hypothetical protein MJ074_08240, partial [Oscillospiraceae bacterium]|nr:hypothetical protein [Oscillospiraceae bacterium]